MEIDNEDDPTSFDLTEKDFILCSSNIKLKETSYIIAVNIIDSYSKTIKITQIIDSNFFFSFESILKQVIPSHENTNFFLLVNCPDEPIQIKIKSISTKIGLFTRAIVKCNDRFCKEKITTDIFSVISLLFKEENLNMYKTI